MAACPKYGFDLAEASSECPRCGVILAKARPSRVQAAEIPSLPVTIPPPQVSAAPPAIPVAGLRGDATKLRLFAATIDNLLAIIIALIVAARLVELPPELSQGGRWIIASLIYLAYYFLQESVWGTTLGKLVFGLCVARLDGKSVGAGEAVWRTLLRVFEANPLLLGIFPGAVAVAQSKRRQRIGDLLAGTVVVRRKELAAASKDRA